MDVIDSQNGNVDQSHLTQSTVSMTHGIPHIGPEVCTFFFDNVNTESFLFLCLTYHQQVVDPWEKCFSAAHSFTLESLSEVLWFFVPVISRESWVLLSDRLINTVLKTGCVWVIVPVQTQCLHCVWIHLTSNHYIKNASTCVAFMLTLYIYFLSVGNCECCWTAEREDCSRCWVTHLGYALYTSCLADWLCPAVFGRCVLCQICSTNISTANDQNSIHQPKFDHSHPWLTPNVAGDIRHWYILSIHLHICGLDHSKYILWRRRKSNPTQ